MVYKRDWVKDVVYLYQFPRSYFCPQLSPFCLKVETWLRLADVKYEVIETFLTKKRSKEGKVPFIELNGHAFHDSELIIRKLTEHFHKQDIDDVIDTDEKKGVAHAVYVMVETHAGEILRYERFADHVHEYFTDKCWPESKLPWLLKTHAFQVLMRKRVMSRVANVYGHSREDNFAFALDDILAVSRILGAKDFIFGDRICSLDCALFSFTAQVYCVPFNPKIREFVDANCQNLEAHFNRVKDLLWSDWDQETAVREEKTEKSEGGNVEKEEATTANAKAEESVKNGSGDDKRVADVAENGVEIEANA